jgi:phospholipid/cholesterol/gamma-HCH transport system permease protein
LSRKYRHTSPPKFHEEVSGTHVRFVLDGPWVASGLSAIEVTFEEAIQALLPSAEVEFILNPGLTLDTTGAWYISKMHRHLKNQGISVILHTTDPLIKEILEPHMGYVINYPTEPASSPWHIQFFDRVGFRAIELYNISRKMVGFFGEILVTLYRSLSDPSAFRLVSLFHHIHEVGVRAIPIISLISFLIGMVLAYQGITQLRKFGGEIFAIDLLGISVLREIAVLMTAIVVAGRSGSAFTAQIGIMALNQEIDAIRIMGLNPIMVLVWPRILALLIALPLLVFLSMIMGLFGGMVLTMLSMDISSGQFIRHLQRAIDTTTFWVGMSKAPIFAGIIGMVGCFRGFQVRGSAESVGRMTTQSVVEAIFLVIICDGIMSIVYSFLRI